MSSILLLLLLLLVLLLLLLLTLTSPSLLYGCWSRWLCQYDVLLFLSITREDPTATTSRVKLLSLLAATLYYYTLRRNNSTCEVELDSLHDAEAHDAHAVMPSIHRTPIECTADNEGEETHPQPTYTRDEGGRGLETNLFVTDRQRQRASLAKYRASRTCFWAMHSRRTKLCDRCALNIE